MGSRRGMQDLGQLVEASPVLERNTEQLGDHERRHFAGEIGDEVTFTPLGHGVSAGAGGDEDCGTGSEGEAGGRVGRVEPLERSKAGKRAGRAP